VGVLQVVEPNLYAPCHFTALFLVAAHAHFQGAQRSLFVGMLPVVVLIPITVATDVPVDSGVLNAYESVFAAACLSSALVVGALRTAESSGRLRAQALSRRTIDTEAEVRRRLAEMIHDGPIQELSSVELMLASAEQDLQHGNTDAARGALSEARGLTRANIRVLRDEIVDLGPAAFEELTFRQAIEDCIEVWERRHGFQVQVDISEDLLPPDVAGALFRITQEAITNVGKHAGASTVAIRAWRPPGQVVLEIEDDGRGFGDVDPLGPGEPGHIGLESMRERAEMLAGRLEVQGRDRGACIRVTIPL
jgi:signal transduction histidine kinase